MVNIKVADNSADIKIQGPTVEVGFEMSKVAELVAKKDKSLAEDMIFGLCQVLSKKEIMETVDLVFLSQEKFNKIKENSVEGFQSLLELLKSLGEK